MEKYNIGDVWWIHFPYEDEDKEKRRPAIVIDDDTIAILAMYVTSQNKENPYSIKLEDWAETGLSKPSWTRIDRFLRSLSTRCSLTAAHGLFRNHCAFWPAQTKTQSHEST